jgi:hypothetical protein
MHAGRLSVRVHGAALDGPRPGAGQPPQLFYLRARAGEYGSLCSDCAPLEEGEGQGGRVRWEQDLTLEVGPAAQTLQLCLYREGGVEGAGDELVGAGSLSLEGLGEAEVAKREVAVALVGEAPPGRRRGEVAATLRFFPSRSPGKGRDALGREVLDPVLASLGHARAARELNERSPQQSPRRSLSRERRGAGEGLGGEAAPAVEAAAWEEGP